MYPVISAASIVRLHGPDAIAFAQFTNDIRGLAPGTCCWNAWLDAQGRVKALFAALRIDEASLLLWQPHGAAESLREELRRYVLRSKLTVECLDGWQVQAWHATDWPASDLRWRPCAGGHALRLPGADARAVALLPGQAVIDQVAALEWRHADIAARLPWIDAPVAACFVPQALELERIDAIRFDKGCYPGQEIAARLHFRGGNKRGLRCLPCADLPPAAGSPLIDAAGATVGHVLYSAAAHANQPAQALAVVQLDAATVRPITESGAPSDASNPAR